MSQKYLKIGAIFFPHNKKSIDVFTCVSTEVKFDDLMLIFTIKMDSSLVYNRVSVKIWTLMIVKISH